jgi:hypothetical protein
MRNNYEMPEALELGEAKTLILGMKVFEPEAFDDIQGLNWKELPGDIDESDDSHETLACPAGLFPGLDSF